MKLAIVMYGSHGGELDRVVAEAYTEDATLAVAKTKLIKMISDATLSIGDTFKIEEV